MSLSDRDTNGVGPQSPRTGPGVVPARGGRIVPVTRGLDDLLAEAESAPIRGWDFSWLDGRASEERPSWGYSRMLGRRLARTAAALDVQTGGGELLAGLDRLPPLMVATEGWVPNLEIARRRLGPRGALVVGAHDDRPGLPFRGDLFDLVGSRQPVTPSPRVM